MSQISRFIAQSGPISISLVALSTIALTIFAFEERNFPEALTGEETKPYKDHAGEESFAQELFPPF